MMRLSTIQAPPPIEKPPLDYESLRDIIDLSLWAGQMLMQNGADSRRIEETVHRLGTGLGANWLDILVSPNVIIATTSSGAEFRTKVRRIVRFGVNMSVISEINELSRNVSDHKLDRFQVRQELERITNMHHHYNRWVVVVMVGLACAAFSQLFGGDEAVFAVTFIASSVAMFVRQEMNKRYFNPLLVTSATAFVAGFLATSAEKFDLSPEPQWALAAAVLLLVPGVPLINSAEDIIEGHMVMGIARGFNGAMITFAIAIGLLLAMHLAGVSGL